MKTARTNKFWLFLLTIIIISLIGAYIWYLVSNPNTCSEADYIEGKDCSCTKDGLLCETSNVPDDQSLSLEDFGIDGLNFSTEFVSEVATVDLLGADLNTLFYEVSGDGNSMVVSIHQKQLCSNDDKPPVQIGMYHLEGNTLTLLSVINTVASVYTQECVVNAKFDLQGLDIVYDNTFVLKYMTEDGEQTNANVCLYNNGVYNNGDVYEAEDGCNLCSCVNGISRCDNDKVCEDERQSLSAYWNFPNYDRLEGEESVGECNVDSECYVRGCSEEVCSPKQEVTTSCEVVTKIEGVKCGCVENVCVWR